MNINDKFKDKLECIEDVKMQDSDNVVFTKGNVYHADLGSHYVSAINNDGDVHCLGTRNDEDRFFQKHFIRVW